MLMAIYQAADPLEIVCVWHAKRNGEDVLGQRFAIQSIVPRYPARMRMAAPTIITVLANALDAACPSANNDRPIATLTSALS